MRSAHPDYAARAIPTDSSVPLLPLDGAGVVHPRSVAASDRSALSRRLGLHIMQIGFTHFKIEVKCVMANHGYA